METKIKQYKGSYFFGIREPKEEHDSFDAAEFERERARVFAECNKRLKETIATFPKRKGVKHVDQL